MKRFLLTLCLVLAALTSLSAMSYDEARRQAWFLTDKMAYELNLTPDQYDRAYEINLNYFLSIDSPADLYGAYGGYRNADLCYVLFDWQWALYRTLDYFVRPVRWVRARWYYPLCDRYRWGYYYFDRPVVYLTYRGAGWRNHRRPGAPSPYYGIRFDRSRGGMRDNYRPWHSPAPGLGSNGRFGRSESPRSAQPGRGTIPQRREGGNRNSFTPNWGGSDRNSGGQRGDRNNGRSNGRPDGGSATGRGTMRTFPVSDVNRIGSSTFGGRGVTRPATPSRQSGGSAVSVGSRSGGRTEGSTSRGGTRSNSGTSSSNRTGRTFGGR